MSNFPTIDFDNLSVIGSQGRDLIEQTEDVPPVEGDGYEGLLELLARLDRLNYEDVISPQEYERLRNQIRDEAKRRGYHRTHEAKTMHDQKEQTTVRIEIHDHGHKTTVATSDTEALEGAKQIAKNWEAAVNRISANVISFEFLSGEHQEKAEMEMFDFWLSDTSVDCFKGGPIPYATN